MSNSINTVSSLTAKKASVIPQSAKIARGGKYSVNIVCAQKNRKSISLSRGLFEKLALQRDVFLTLYADDRIIAISSLAIDTKSVKYSFSNETSRLIYNTSLVYFLVDTFNLDYSTRTSLSFSNIDFDTVDGVAVAVVNIPPSPQEESVSEN
jgi:hypothetical protein